jgi:glycosyltransferase involved in cell wall biosynthesis
MTNKTTILSDSWYTNHLSEEVINIDEHLAKTHNRFILKITKKIKFIKGYLIFKAGKKSDIIITHLSHDGINVLLILEALFSKKKNRIILLEFIRQTPLNNLKRKGWLFYTKFIFSPALRKTLCKAQVLTTKEKEIYSRSFNMEPDKFCYVPWPLHGMSTGAKDIADIQNSFKPQFNINEPYVMVSGKANVDWETIFAVAERSNWQLLAVCLAKQLDRIKRLNKNGKVKILNDISYEDHGQYVKNATVYALCLEATDVSVGQVRLMNTNEHGVPVVASAVAGLDGYAVDGINALMVPTKNVEAFKEAVDRLMINPELRHKLIKSAKEFQQSRTFENYIADIVGIIKSLIH